MNRFRQQGGFRLFASFGHALRGFRRLFMDQPNARIHAAATCAVLALAAYLRVSTGEWLALVLSIGLVLAAEALNSAIEELADAVHPDQHPGIGRAKDVAAAGVLLAALAAVATGAIIFLPRLLP